MGLIDPDYKIKYKHLFRKAELSTICSLRDDIAVMIKAFNEDTHYRFYADDRILIPGTDDSMPRHGIIIEHQGKNEEFDKDFSDNLEHIKSFARKLDSRTTLYEYSFKTEFCNKDSWVDYENKKVAYNLSL